jgi:hypothetical protein
MSRPLSIHIFKHHDVSANVLPYTITDRLVSYGSTVPAAPTNGSIFFDTTENNALMYAAPSWKAFDQDKREIVFGTSRPVNPTMGQIFLDTSAGKPFWYNQAGQWVTFAAEVTAAAFQPSDVGEVLFWLDPTDTDALQVTNDTPQKFQRIGSSRETPIGFAVYPTASASTSPPVLSTHPNYGGTRKWIQFNGNTGFISDTSIAGFPFATTSYTIFLIGINTGSGADCRLVSFSTAVNLDNIASIRTTGSQINFLTGTTTLVAAAGQTSLTNTWATTGRPFLVALEFSRTSGTTNAVTVRQYGTNADVSGTPISNTVLTTTTSAGASFVPGIIGIGMQPNTGTPTGRWIGYLGDVLVMSGTMTDSTRVVDRQKIEGYLAHKWNIATNILPVGHPYRTSPP